MGPGTAPSIYIDGSYLARTGSWHEEDSPWKAYHVKTMLERNGLEPKTICEVGCGAGEILNWLSRALPGDERFYGYEVSPQAYELCRARAHERLSFRLGDLLAGDGPPYDVLMAIDVFEHVEDYLGFLRRLRLKARYKIFHIPLDLSVQSVLRAAPILKLRREVGHLHYFTKETALKTLEDAGYEVLDYFYTATAVELPGRGWKANLMKLPRNFVFALSPDWAARLLGGYSLMVLAK
ncbi:MAG: class I SAM-dependent methyltransferase [Methyloceanibacter sp.]|uniref:class I SAM-dependent methyltransferase n=1 Tax=Methyloceanibacter sp. TaxID=1965321 RepID=UPI003D6D478B